MKVGTTASPVSRSKRQSATNRGATRPRDSEGKKRSKGAKADIRMTINRPAEELFSFWRNFENLPQIMKHIESVTSLEDTRWRWLARLTKDDAENHIEWVSEVINERPDEMIAWRTVEGSQVQYAGSIWFKTAPGNLGTEVTLEVAYETNTFVDFIAKLTRRSPAQQMREDLRHFKQLMEAGEIPTTAGQSAGRTDDVAAKYQESK